jgi:hypothetical protein
MTTSQKKSMLSELASGLPIPVEKRAYFHARVLNGFYQYVLQKFLEEERAGRLNKRQLALRIERKPEVISRLLGAPGNWTLETATDLLLGIAGEELRPASSPLLGRPNRNYRHADWISTRETATQQNAVQLLKTGKGSEASTTPPIKSEVTLHAPV